MARGGFSKRQVVKSRVTREPEASYGTNAPKIGLKLDNKQPLGAMNSKLRGMTEKGQDGEANNYPAQRKSRENRRGPADNHSVSVKVSGKGRAGV